MWRAFVCASYAEFAKQADERKRLFQVGYDAGIAFYEAVKKGEISRDDIKARVPLGVIWRMEGPSSEFLVGRVFEGAATFAHELVVKRDEANEPRKDRVTDLQAQMAIAQSRYRSANCALIR